MTRVIYGDGWHIVCGFRVYVVDKCIMRGVSNNQQLATFPYVWRDWANCWVNAHGIGVEAFRSAYKRGRAMMK